MAVKRYEHQIYHIAHPLMQKLIRQAIDVRKFQAIYPELFSIMKGLRNYPTNTGLREYVAHKLCLALKDPLQKHFDFESDDQLLKQLNIILFDRRLIDQALGYIQTGQVYLHDEFLVKNILTKQQLTDIFEKISLDFWEGLVAVYAKKITSDENISEQYIKTLKKVLDIKGWYLPNLLAAWSIGQLFVDYMSIALEYDKYKATDDDTSYQVLDSTKKKQYPTYAETKKCLKHLFLYDQPVLNSKKAFIDFHTDKNGERSSRYFGVNVGLDDTPQSLPSILSAFVLSYSSRRIDYFREGKEGGLKEGHDLQQMSKVVNQLTEMLDKLINKDSFLDRYDTILSALLALLYFDGVFSQLSRQDYIELEDLNFIELFRHFKYLEDSEERVEINLQTEQEMRQQILTPSTSYTIDDLVQKIVELFEGNEKIKLELKTKSGKKPTHLLFTLKNEKLSYELDVKGMKRKIKIMLGHFFLNEEELVLE